LVAELPPLLIALLTLSVESVLISCAPSRRDIAYRSLVNVSSCNFAPHQTNDV
jgi:hypothetical protein